MISEVISIGDLRSLIEIIVIAIGGIYVVITLRLTVSKLAGDIADLKGDIKALNKIVVEMAVTTTRLDAVEQDIRELRHGRGFIREAIEGEWPKLPPISR